MSLHDEILKIIPASKITLRDYFAAAALRGMLSDPSAPPMPSIEDAWAKAAYRHADAMLRVRSA